MRGAFHPIIRIIPSGLLAQELCVLGEEDALVVVDGASIFLFGEEDLDVSFAPEYSVSSSLFDKADRLELDRLGFTNKFKFTVVAFVGFCRHT